MSNNVAFKYLGWIREIIFYLFLKKLIANILRTMWNIVSGIEIGFVDIAIAPFHRQLKHIQTFTFVWVFCRRIFLRFHKLECKYDKIWNYSFQHSRTWELWAHHNIASRKPDGFDFRFKNLETHTFCSNPFV